MVLSKFKHPFGIAVIWTSLSIVLALGLSGAVYGIVLFSLVGTAALWIKKRSLGDVLLSLVLWHISILGLVRGFFIRIEAPESEIQYRVLKETGLITVLPPEEGRGVKNVHSFASH